MKLSKLSEEARAIIASNLTVAAAIFETAGTSRIPESVKQNVKGWFNHYLKNLDEKK